MKYLLFGLSILSLTACAEMNSRQVDLTPLANFYGQRSDYSAPAPERRDCTSVPHYGIYGDYQYSSVECQ